MVDVPRNQNITGMLAEFIIFSSIYLSFLIYVLVVYEIFLTSARVIDLDHI